MGSEHLSLQKQLRAHTQPQATAQGTTGVRKHGLRCSEMLGPNTSWDKELTSFLVTHCISWLWLVLTLAGPASLGYPSPRGPSLCTGGLQTHLLPCLRTVSYPLITQPPFCPSHIHNKYPRTSLALFQSELRIQELRSPRI